MLEKPRDQCGWRGGTAEGSGRSWEVQVVWALRSVTFTQSKTGSHWRALNREVARYDLCFNGTTLPAELGSAYLGPGQRRGEEQEGGMVDQVRAVQVVSSLMLGRF